MERTVGKRMVKGWPKIEAMGGSERSTMAELEFLMRMETWFLTGIALEMDLQLYQNPLLSSGYIRRYVQLQHLSHILNLNIPGEIT